MSEQKHLWEVDHPYYCTEGNYFSTQERHQTIFRFKSWGEFLAEMRDADPDYNLIFRWDWREGRDHELAEYNGDDNYRHAEFVMFVMHQRKGYHSTSIVEVCRADEPQIIEFLRPRFAHLLKLWEPLAKHEHGEG